MVEVVDQRVSLVVNLLHRFPKDIVGFTFLVDDPGIVTMSLGT